MDIFILILLIIIGGLFYLLSPVLLPFILGVLFAYLLAPSVEKLSQKMNSRTKATLVPLVIFMLFIFTILAVGVPFLLDDISAFIYNVPQYAAWLEKAFNEGGLLYNFANQYNLPMDKASIQSHIYAYSDQIALAALDTLRKAALGAMAIFDALSLLIITPLVTFYLLHDWPYFIHHLEKMVPQDLRKKTVNILQQVDIKLSAFLRGQLSVCLLLGLFYGLGLSLLGLKMGFFIGFLTGLLSFIPFIGMALGFIFAITLAIMQYQLTSIEPYIIIVAIFAVGQILEGFVLTPRLVGRRTGLHPVWVIFAVMAGAELGGFLGMLVALPLATILTVVLPTGFESWLNARLQHKKGK